MSSFHNLPPMPLSTLPRCFDGPRLPMLKLDSPFPPLKTEHRYRGVYERAGFDVNLGGLGNRTVLDPHSPGVGVRQDRRNHLATHLAKTPKPAVAFHLAPTSRSASNHYAPATPGSERFAGPRSHFSPKSAGIATPTSGSFTQNKHQAFGVMQTLPEKFSVPRRAPRGPPEEFQFQLFQPVETNTLTKDGPGHVHGPGHEHNVAHGHNPRNVKNLALNLNQNPNQNEPVERSANSSPFDSGIDDETANTSAESTGKVSPKSVATANLFNPPYPVEKPLSPESPEVPQRSTARGAPDPISLDPVDLVGLDVAEESRDYSFFLAQPAREPSAAHLSTISSIISKPEMEEDEVDLELQRQLELLKTGSALTLGLDQRNYEDASFVTAPELLVSLVSLASLPRFSIHDTARQSVALQTALNQLPETVVVPHDFETPIVQSAPFDEPTPETIKPLSPKSHRVDEELQGMNLHTEFGDLEILLHNPPPEEFRPFPELVILPNHPQFRGEKHAPGEGPCRGCDKLIDAGALGLLKPIFLKLGELSGQWHRGCFSCAYVGCDVMFSKHISCYVLLDNAFCEHHYHTLNGTLCHKCNTGIEGACIENELKHKWHLHCLVCTQCGNSIDRDYYMVNGEIVCEEDARRSASKDDRIEKRRTRLMYVDQLRGL